MKYVWSSFVSLLVPLCLGFGALAPFDAFAQSPPPTQIKNLNISGQLNGNPLPAGPIVDTTSPQTLANKSLDARQILYNQGGTSAATQSILTRLKSRINIWDFVATNQDIGNGTTDAGPALQAAINACNHCVIEVPHVNPRTGTTVTGYNLVTPITGHANMLIQGETVMNNHLNAPSAGSVFLAGQTSSPMFTFPGSTNLDAEVAVGWGFKNMRFECNNSNQPAIFAPEANPGRGSWGAFIAENIFHQCRPAIAAQNGWDWWILNNAFNQTGNAATGTGAQTAGLYIYNSAQTYTGAASNSWRVTGNTFDLLTGQGIQVDSSGSGSAVQFMTISGNHFGPKGYESITGCIELSNIENNVSEGSNAGHPIFNITGTRSECGRNRIVGNNLSAPGTFAISDAGVLDHIADNMFYVNGSGGAYISLTATSSLNTVTDNKTNDSSCCNTVPIVADAGSGNSIFHNDGSDGVVTNGFLPEKIGGSQYYAPLFTSNSQKIDGNWTAYAPTLSCLSGSLSSGSAAGYYKQIGKTTFVTITVTVTTAGTCGGLGVTIPSIAALPFSISGVESAVTGKLAAGFGNATTNTMLLRLADATSAAVNGYIITLNGVYPAQ